MTESDILQLIHEIEEASATIFWWENPVLARAALIHDPRIVRVLAFRHHCLGNKKAFSAHVVRHTIRLSDGPELPTLWACIDEESDSTAIIERMEDFHYLPWASAFIIGEIGGKSAFIRILERLSSEHSARHYLLVRLFSHLMVRYLSIVEETEPQTTFIDLKTGEKDSLLSRYGAPASFEMESRKRKEANELFTPLSRKLVQEAEVKLAGVPDNLLNMKRSQFTVAFEYLRKSIAMRGG
jgi:hypothetical protein